VIATGAQLTDFVSQVWYRDPAAEDAGRYDAQGLMDITAISARLASPDTHFYLCGPLPFMQHVVAQLRDASVADTRIHYELFGPHKGM
jgi:nitric oxide dioxygenase